MRERALGGEHPEVAAALNNLAVLLRAVEKASSGLHCMCNVHFLTTRTDMPTLLWSSSLGPPAMCRLRCLLKGRL